ncbi:CC/Se motif family (seleno)protein [Halalkalibacter nanhaiisediminis]|uniref:Fe-S cluster assembly iron-binding protein IscA n=1 Tax=Halalkalibacter nanhaiisediminis TaxID=688079 RepID=A0A562QQQ9_9BACI|nr:CC/Se motif family (seleno)protein [Halalkalibacter nanhaiisediminis]TWI59047.1 hypothetical protein IQ10_00758 [Halalkalibacter nanhaiisediminis]
MALDIELNDNVKKWIESKGSHLTVEAVSMNACCGGYEEFMTSPKKPNKPQNFNEFKIDNISVHVHRNILLKDKITLELSGFSFFKSISAKTTML